MASMPNLFNHNLIKTHIQKHYIDLYEEKIKVIQGWKKSLQTVKGFNEKALQSAFLQGIFGKVLGINVSVKQMNGTLILKFQQK